MITNALSIDVEDYFQVSAFEKSIDRSTWDSIECRVEQNIELILSILARHDVKATFFILGWIAEKFPAMIKRIAEAGHEIASHGMNHRRITSMSREEFEQDIDRSKKLLQDISGRDVRGFRAPSFSINEACSWAFECLIVSGYEYSSSIYPIKHDHYGDPESRRFIHERPPGIIEIPITTYRWMNRNFPASGGGYFRLLPYSVSKWLFSRVNEIENQPVVFYFHPWEVDHEQPRIKSIDRKTAFRHYVNLDKTAGKIDSMLKDFKWDRIDNVFLNAEVR